MSPSTICLKTRMGVCLVLMGKLPEGKADEVVARPHHQVAVPEQRAPAGDEGGVPFTPEPRFLHPGTLPGIGLPATGECQGKRRASRDDQDQRQPTGWPWPAHAFQTLFPCHTPV